MTAVLHIEIKPLRYGRAWRVRHSGAVLLADVRVPFCDAAREFVRRGYPPETRLEMRHEGETVIALSGTIGKAAGLTVRETAKAGPYFIRWTPFPADAGIGRTAETGLPATMARPDTNGRPGEAALT